MPQFAQFDVERIDTDTRIEISCTPKPGLLLSTVNTLEALGLDVQQCVISCFNDFSMQASCSEVQENFDRSFFTRCSLKKMIQIIYIIANYAVLTEPGRAAANNYKFPRYKGSIIQKFRLWRQMSINRAFLKPK